MTAVIGCLGGGHGGGGSLLFEDLFLAWEFQFHFLLLLFLTGSATVYVTMKNNIMDRGCLLGWRCGRIGVVVTTPWPWSFVKCGGS